MMIKKDMITVVCTVAFAALSMGNPACGEKTSGVVEPGAQIRKLADGFGFSEGPVSDSDGNVYFSDYGKDIICRWSLDDSLSTVMKEIGGPIGLYFDQAGRLLICAARSHRIKAVDTSGVITEYPDTYHGKLLNSPNDIWVDPKGGIYFTDPRFAPLKEKVEQDGYHVYYIPPGTTSIIRAADDLSRPNGIIGSLDGRLVYVTDTPDDKTFVYTVNEDGTLSNKKIFAKEGYDGMTVDVEGNVYITMEKSIEVYSQEGKKVDSIPVPDKPTNVCFGGKDKKTLFITARVSLYSLRMRVRGQ